MFIVIRTFRDSKGVRTVGSVIEPTDTNRFQYRLNTGNIVEITEHNLERYKRYFKQKHGIDIVPEEPEEPVTPKVEKAVFVAKVL